MYSSSANRSKSFRKSPKIKKWEQLLIHTKNKLHVIDETHIKHFISFIKHPKFQVLQVQISSFYMVLHRETKKQNQLQCTEQWLEEKKIQTVNNRIDITTNNFYLYSSRCPNNNIYTFFQCHLLSPVRSTSVYAAAG